MDFQNERHVRIYPAVTETTRAWGFWGRVLMDQLVKSADLAGVVDLDPNVAHDDLGAAVAFAIGCPDPVWVSERLPLLLEDGAVVVQDNSLFLPRYFEGQYSTTSASLSRKQYDRKKRDLQRARDLGLVPLSEETDAA